MPDNPSISPARQRIVILGGGFGGVYTAHHLERLGRRQPVDVTLISRDNYLLMTPLLFEAGTGVLEPRHTVNPLRPLFSRTRFVEGEIAAVDFDRRVVKVAVTEQRLLEVAYDQLVIALGGVTNRAIIPGSQDALAFKTLADAIYLRNHTIDLMERADAEPDPQRKRQLLTFVIVGGGLVGVELVGEMTEFLRNLVRSYPRVRYEEIRIELLEAGPQIMKEMDRDLADYGVKVLEKRRVKVRPATPVQRIEPERVHLPGGELIEAATIVLSAGVAPNPVLAGLDIAMDRKGRIAVDATMRSTSRPEVWALGDCAVIPDPQGNPYPQLAQHALRQAKVLAGNILGSITGKPPQPFVYQTLGTLAALGHYKGIGRVWKFKTKGFIAWWVWRTYYLLQMPRFERRLRIMLDWTVALLFKNDVAKLDLFGEEHPRRRRLVGSTEPPTRTPDTAEKSGDQIIAAV
jgi:NADH dehydrogenase